MVVHAVYVVVYVEFYASVVTLMMVKLGVSQIVDS